LSLTSGRSSRWSSAIISAICGLLFPSLAAAADYFVDNTILGSGTITASQAGLAANQIDIQGVAFANGADEMADLVFCGFEIHTGTGSAPKSYKIQSFGAPTATTITLYNNLEDGTPNGTSQYRVTRGANDNNGQAALPAVGANGPGPRATVTAAYKLLADDVSKIWVRYSGRDYDEGLRSTRATANAGSLIFDVAQRSFVIEGFKDLDGSNNAVPFTQAPAAIYAPKIDGRNYLLTSAAEQLTTTNLPMIRPVTRDVAVEIKFAAGVSGFSGSAGGLVAFRFLQFDVPANRKMVQFSSQSEATTYTLRFDRCILGTGTSLVSTGQYAFYDDSVFSGGQPTGGQTKTFEFTKCKLAGTEGGIYAACAAALVVEDCHLVFTGNNAGSNGGSGPNADAGHAIYVVSESTNGAGPNDPRRAVKRVRVRRSKIEVTSLGQSVNLGSTNGCIHGSDRGAPESQLAEYGLEFTDHFEVTDCRLKSTNSVGHPLYQKGCPSIDWQRNHVTGDRYNAAAVGGIAGSATCIRAGPGANVTFIPAYNRHRTLLRGTCTGGSATTVTLQTSGVGTIDQAADAYKNRLVRVTKADGSARLTRMISASAWSVDTLTLTHTNSASPAAVGHGAWDAATTSGGFGPGNAPAAGDRYEVLEEIFNQSIIADNWCEHLNTTGQNGRSIQIGIGADGTHCTGNVCLKGDIGIWVLSNHNFVAHNKVYAGEPLEVKGASWNRIVGNSLVMANLPASTKNCVSLLDVSAYDDSQARHWQHFSKCEGNVFVQNIVANIGQAGTDGVFGYCLYELSQGSGKWAGKQPTWRPAGQFNLFDRNLYWRDDNADGVSELDATHALMRLNAGNVGTSPTAATSLQQVRDFWSSTGGAPYTTYFSTNEAGSAYGNPLFTNPAAGDFSLSPNSPAIAMGAGAGLTARVQLVAPITSTAKDGMVRPSPISIFVGTEQPSITWICADSAGTAINLAGESVRLTVWRPDGTTLFQLTSAAGGLTIAGASANEVTEHRTAGLVGETGTFRYLLERTSSGVMAMAAGQWRIVRP
jgi:hypothetical protein